MSSTALKSWEDQIKKDASAFADNVSSVLTGELKVRSAELLADAAILSARTIAGENTTTAQIALNASMQNLAREAQAVVVKEGRDLALRTAWSLLTLLLKA